MICSRCAQIKIFACEYYIGSTVTLCSVQSDAIFLFSQRTQQHQQQCVMVCRSTYRRRQQQGAAPTPLYTRPFYMSTESRSKGRSQIIYCFVVQLYPSLPLCIVVQEPYHTDPPGKTDMHARKNCTIQIIQIEQIPPGKHDLQQ